MTTHGAALAAASGLVLVLAAAAPAAPVPEPPNILWLTTEDMSPALGAFGDAYARTPNLDRLARDGVRYTRAYASAPICSPSRSALITGVYASSLGTQHLRSSIRIPGSIRTLPSTSASAATSRPTTRRRTTTSTRPAAGTRAERTRTGAIGGPGSRSSASSTS